MPHQFDAIPEHWLPDYSDRRAAFHQEVIQACEASWQAALQEVDGSLNLAHLDVHARTRRAALEHKFCMLLWSRNFNGTLFDEYSKGIDLGMTAEEARRLLRQKATGFRPRIATLTFRLDRAGFFALMLYPEGKDDAPPEPVVFRAPPQPIPLKPPAQMDPWFYLFTGFVELAQAIVVEGNYGEGLAAELKYVEHLGLSERVLYFDVNGELYRENDSLRWPLERLGEAVAYAAAQDVRVQP